MKSSTIVILEDDLARIELFIKKLENRSNLNIFNTVDSCFFFIKENKNFIDMIFLDHDLDGKTYVDSNEYNTGYTLSKKIKELYDEEYPDTIIHSLNPKGSNNIHSVLTKAQIIPFPVLINSI